MPAEFYDLLNDEHFLFKLANAAVTFYGFKSLLEYGCIKDTFQATVINLALPGGFLAMCLLMLMYWQQSKNENVEKLLLVFYGVMNALSAYICWKKIDEYVGSPGSLHICNPVVVMLFTSVFNACSMLGEALSCQETYQALTPPWLISGPEDAVNPYKL